MDHRAHQQQRGLNFRVLRMIGAQTVPPLGDGGVLLHLPLEDEGDGVELERKEKHRCENEKKEKEKRERGAVWSF